MLQKILLASIATAGAGYMYFGMHKAIKVDELELNSKLFVYRPFRGDYWDMAPALKKMAQDFQGLDNKQANLAAFYYDNPRNMMDRTAGRAVLGGLFDPTQRATVEDFLRKHEEFKLLETQPVKTLNTEFPYRGNMSFRLSRFKKIRSRLYRYGFKNGRFSNGDRNLVGLMEVYPFLNGGERQIQVYVPYGKNAEQFRDLHGMETPQLKNKAQYPGIIGDFNYIFFK
jgi:hypothetical protein